VRRARALAAALAPVVLAGVAVLGIASPASADASKSAITSPQPNQTFGTAGTVQVTADAEYSVPPVEYDTVTLALLDPAQVAQAPGGCGWSFRSTTNAGTFGGPLDLASPYPTDCALHGRPARNGQWEVRLTGGGADDTRAFSVRVPPAVPGNARVAAGQGQDVAVRWDAPREPDTHAFDLLDGSTVLGSVDTAAACDAASCTASLSFPRGGSHQIVVRARRSACPACPAGQDLTAATPPQAVTVPVPPEPPAAQAPAGAVASPGRGRAPAATGGGSGALVVPGGRLSPAQKRQAQKLLGTPAPANALPPLPAQAAPGQGQPPARSPAAGSARERGEPGGYGRTLGYQPLTVPDALEPASDPPLSGVADALGVSPAGLWRSLAGAFVLLLGAAHLRRWARHGQVR